MISPNNLVIEKIKMNEKREKYLKLISISCLCIDLITSNSLETIEIIFSKLDSTYVVLFLTKAY